MANETTSGTLEEMVNSEWIDPAMQDYAHEHLNAQRFTLKADLRGTGSATWAKPRFETDMGTINDGGTGVDTEFDIAEASQLTDTELSTTESTISLSEYGLSHKVTDTALEDMIDGFQLMTAIAANGARILNTAKEDDLVGNFTSASNATSDTGSDATLSDIKAMITALRNRGVRWQTGGLVGILSPIQISDLEDDADSVGSNDVIFPGAADRMMRVNPTADNGGMTGHVMTVRGVDLYESGLVDNVNTGDDDNGAIFVRGDVPAQMGFAALGQAVGREFRLEIQRGAEGARSRASIVVMSERAGFGILQDDAIQGLVTGAT